MKRQEYDLSRENPSSSSSTFSRGFPGPSRASQFAFKSPSQVFAEFFGQGNNPFDDPFFTEPFSNFDSHFDNHFDNDFDSHFDRMNSRMDRMARDAFQNDAFTSNSSLFSNTNTSRGNSFSKSTSTRIVNGQMESITTTRDSQGNITIEKTTRDSQGNVNKTITVNGEPQGSTVNGRRIQIT